MSPSTLYLFISPSTPPKSPGCRRCAIGFVECVPGRRVNKPIWNAPSCPSAPLNRSLFIPQGLLHAVFPGFPKAFGLSSSSLFPLNTHDGSLCPSVMLEGGSRSSCSLSCASPTSQCLAPRHTQQRGDLCHCPSEWESRAGTSNRRP